MSESELPLFKWDEFFDDKDFCRTNNSSICNMSMGRSKSKSKSKSNICNTVYTLIEGNIPKPIEDLVWSDIFGVTKNVSVLEDPKITKEIMINNNPYFIKYCCSTCMDDLFYEFLVGAILRKIGLPHIPKVYMYLSETETFHYDDKTLFLKDNMDKQQYCVKKQHAIIEEYIEGEQLSKIDDANRKIEILKRIVDLQANYPYIIHNDLHTNNILIGKDNTPYIIDLGRVRLINYQLPNEVRTEFDVLDNMIQKYSTNNCFFRLYDYQSTLEYLQQIPNIGAFNHLVNQNFFLYPILKYCCNVKAIGEDYYQILTHNIKNVTSEQDLFQLLISNIQTLLKIFDRNRSKSITKTHKRKHRSVKKSVSRSKKSKTRKIMKNPKPWIPPG
jgi:serine/threonine-protein kinase RIO1